MSTVKVVKSKLSFKGDKKGIDKKQKSLKRNYNEETIEKSSSISKIIVNDNKNEPQEEEIVIVQGTGRLTSSSTTISGHFTNFMNELSVGDAIIITHPNTLQEETKIVRMVLSNISISISSAFSTDLITTTPFRYIKAPKDEEQEKNEEEKLALKKTKLEQEAFGTYSSNNGEVFVYREKKTGSFGGYKIVSEKLTESVTREKLLDMRTKKKSDRFVYLNAVH